MERKGEVRMTNKLLKELNELQLAIRNAQDKCEAALCELNKLKTDNDLETVDVATKFENMQKFNLGVEK